MNNIVSTGKHYLYRHIRLDNNEVFYIGVGTKKRSKFLMYTSEFERAYDKDNRNVHWTNIINMSEYTVDILLESNNYKFILQKEKEFIKLYGRKDLGLGTLVNLTDGGEGQCGWKMSESTKKKIGEKALNRKPSLEVRKKMSDAQKAIKGKGRNSSYSKKVYQYSIDGEFIKEWFCITDITRETGQDRGLIIKCCKKNKNNHSAYGFRWFYDYKGKKISPLKINGSKKSCKLTDTTNNKEYLFDSITEAGKFCNRKDISNILYRKKNKVGKYLIEVIL